jgi:hypothetical protein
VSGFEPLTVRLQGGVSLAVGNGANRSSFPAGSPSASAQVNAYFLASVADRW